jgi:hypothetical protein
MMDVQKYRIMLKDVGFEENVDTSVNEKNPLVLHKRFLLGEMIVMVVFDFRRHEEKTVVYYLYNETSEKCLHNDLLPYITDCKEFLVIFNKDGGKLVNGG